MTTRRSFFRFSAGVIGTLLSAPIFSLFARNTGEKIDLGTPGGFKTWATMVVEFDHTPAITEEVEICCYPDGTIALCPQNGARQIG